jgi:hypothetical protein
LTSFYAGFAILPVEKTAKTAHLGASWSWNVPNCDKTQGLDAEDTGEMEIQEYKDSSEFRVERGFMNRV